MMGTSTNNTSKPGIFTRIWLGRILISAVVFANIQCALVFIFDPSDYLRAFDLSGIPGEIAIQGYGILFIMWNVPYLVAIIHPRRYQRSLYEAITMQTIGLLGESFLFLKLTPAYPNLRVSILRFIWFDGIGLVLLLVSWMVTRNSTAGERIPDQSGLT